jgi:hypothetical protein
MEATWYKLKDGTWGVKIRHDGQPGEEVTVTNKKGDSKKVFLNARMAKFEDAQLWSISDVSVAKIESSGKTDSSSSNRPIQDPF